MIKKRLSLSLIAMIGSVFLFVIASFAWFTLSDIVNVTPNIIQSQDVDVTGILYESDDNITYTEVSDITFENGVPGDVKYYKIVVTNNNSFAISTQISMVGITNTYTDIAGDTSNFNAGRSLLDVVLLSASNTADAETIASQTLTSLLIGGVKIISHDNVPIPSGSTVEFYFSLMMDINAGNDYENLQLDISNIYIQSFD